MWAGGRYYQCQHHQDCQMGPAPEAQVVQTFQKAQELGLTVLRMWAFADGNEWNALQPELELLDDKVLSCAPLEPMTLQKALLRAANVLGSALLC